MDERPAGWQPDPTGRHEHRYWDGAAWTVHVSDGGIRSEEPLEVVPPAPDATPTAEEPTLVEPAPVIDVAPPVEPAPAVEPAPVVESAPVATEPAPRRGRRRALAALVVVLALGGAALAVVLTKDDDVSSSIAAEIRSTFDGVSKTQADCLAEKVEAALSEKELTGLALDKPNPGPAEEQALTAISNSLSACGAAQASPTPVASTDGADGGAGTTSTALDEAAYRQQLATFYVGMLDATQEQAECLAGAVIAAGKEAEKTSSTLPELATFFDDCHIDHASPLVTSP